MVEVREVRSHGELRSYVTYPNRLYKDVPQYMPPFIYEDMDDWDRKKNPAFDYCDARCWIAYRDNKIVGRIGAILSRAANEKWNTKRLRFTQVDFIDDPEVSKALFDTVEKWARELGCDEVHGPLGFTDLDREGMLIDGYDRKSMFITYYNHPYYRKHLERLGYDKDVDWIEYLIKVPAQGDPVSEKLERISQRVLKMTKTTIADVKSRKEFGPYVEKVFKLINTCYSGLYGTVDLTEKQIKKYADKFIPMIDPRLACFVMDEKGDMVGFGISAPSMAAAIKKHNGHMYPIGWIDVLKALHTNDTLDLYLIAIHPDYQDRGLNAAIMNHVLKGCWQIGIKQAETGPQLEMNNKIHNTFKYFEIEEHKRRRCFIKKLGPAI